MVDWAAKGPLRHSAAAASSPCLQSSRDVINAFRCVSLLVVVVSHAVLQIYDLARCVCLTVAATTASLLSLTEAIKSSEALPGSQNPRLLAVFCRFSAGSVFCSALRFCLLGSGAVPTQGGDESIGTLPVGVPDTRVSSDASHFSAPADPVTGLFEKMRFL